MDQQDRKQELMTKYKINSKQVEEYEKIFINYEKQTQKGQVLTKDIPAVMKVLGITITEQEIIDQLGDLVNRSDSSLHSSSIDFLTFMTLFLEKQNEMALKEELVEAFKVFEPESTGTILVSQLRYYLRKYGVTMPEDEVEELLKESEPEDGRVNYERFINKLLGLNKE